jgi:hypothetical protein
MEPRITPEEINDLPAGFIFVFGSNEGGHHNKGAALTAKKWGAKMGLGIGMSGRTYGIPTKQRNYKYSLILTQVKKYVDDFNEFAKQNQELNFYVTKIGCGLAGFTIAEIAPLFSDVKDLPNIYLPQDFIDILNKCKN